MEEAGEVEGITARGSPAAGECEDLGAVGGVQGSEVRVVRQPVVLCVLDDRLEQLFRQLLSSLSTLQLGAGPPVAVSSMHDEEEVVITLVHVVLEQERHAGPSSQDSALPALAGPWEGMWPVEGGAQELQNGLLCNRMRGEVDRVRGMNCWVGGEVRQALCTLLCRRWEGVNMGVTDNDCTRMWVGYRGGGCECDL